MSGNVGIFVDLILLALLLIGLVLGWRQGFVQALTRIIVVVAALHLWKRQMLLSIAGGTVCYMLLVQLVF